MATVARFPLPHAAMEEPDARRFLPPPDIHPNNAVFGAVSLPKPLTWQRREHMVQRRNILGRIGQLLKRNAQLVVNADGNQEEHEAQSKTWALARKIEVLIFLNSASLLEYSNVDSLARRVQAMTTSIVNKKIRRQVGGNPSTSRCGSPPAPVFPEAAPAPRVSVTAAIATTAAPYPMDPVPAMPLASLAVVAPVVMQPVAGPASPAPSTPSSILPSIGRLVPKRSAAEMVTSPRLFGGFPDRETKRARRSVELGQLLLRGYDEISKMVWSYVDGVQIMRCRQINRTAQVLVPMFVTSLELSCNSIQQALATPSSITGGCILRECVNLKHLEVVSLSSGMTFGKLSMRAMNCPQRFVVTHDDHEQIVLALSEQLRFNAFPQLTRLGLTCLFTNEEADGEADVLLNNLMTGCCPQLQELCLPGNSFGDYGAMKVAQMLRSRVCPKLTRLDLRRNFIAEEGLRSICHALADGCAPDLVELCLGGNTITDSCFHHILFAMESRQLTQLRFLGIEMNYLTATSMEMLGRTIGKMVCPQLSQISYSDNSVDNTEAKRLIATTVYQERVLRQRQQQLRRQQSQMNGGQVAFGSDVQHPQLQQHAMATRYGESHMRRSMEAHDSSGEDDDDDHYSSDSD
ncbi:hypothetical protein Poli38472_008400 [Pythium oligandrum]|uniref:Uncharacterized protein n=1 Tax=Pythium oligandrum TaxID=41045 RepID=A0A8K1FPL8_PYTOL|nr:hypothetical protein Poli38472_008400 [Pythium oligandrum]|eukprot:TMW65758.1 hypothetical protein Poli38472_008400 [Pythium oligandrum]